MFDAEKGPPDVDSQHPVEVLDAHLLDGLADVYSGIVHQDVKLSSLIDQTRQRGFPTLIVGHVQADEPGTAALRNELGGNGPALLLLDVADKNQGALEAEPAGDGQSQTLRRAGDEGNFIFETHWNSPSIPTAKGGALRDGCDRSANSGRSRAGAPGISLFAGVRTVEGYCTLATVALNSSTSALPILGSQVA